MSNRDKDDRHVDRNETTTTEQTSHTERTERTPNPGERGKVLSALLALLGLWMIGQAFGLELAAAQFWNDIAVGAILAAIGVYNYTRRSDERLANMPVALIAALVGLWLIAAPFVLGAGGGAAETVNDVAFWNDVVVGLLAFVIGAYSAYKVRDRQRDAQHRTAT